MSVQFEVANATSEKHEKINFIFPTVHVLFFLQHTNLCILCPDLFPELCIVKLLASRCSELMKFYDIGVSSKITYNNQRGNAISCIYFPNLAHDQRQILITHCAKMDNVLMIRVFAGTSLKSINQQNNQWFIFNCFSISL